MKLLQPLVLAFLLILLTSCRSAQQKSTAVFDPMTLGPAGPTLKKYLDRSDQPPRSTPTVARVQIEAELPNMSKKGVMVVDKTVDAKGHISYEMKSFTGDNIVKTKVIGLYLSAEQEASQHQVPAIMPPNYRFRFKRKDSLGDRIAMVFDLTPIRKVIGLFKGELWLEEQSGLEIKQTGRLVKNPSVIFKSADLTREFQIKGEESFLSNVDYQAETRVVGKVLMKMQLDEPRPAEETPSRP